MSTHEETRRDLDEEFEDNEERKYAYEFDERLRGYILRAFEPFRRRGASRALEMGCFEGDFTAHLVKLYAEVTVLEGSPTLAAQVQERFAGAVQVITGRFEDVDLPEGSYDAIYLIHVLEHLDDPVGALTRARRWLAEDGVLFVASPNGNAASRQIAVQMGLITHNEAVTPGEHEHGHRITYTLDTLTRHVQDAGLAVDSTLGIFFKPLANFQFDLLTGGPAISEQYLEGCYKLGFLYPDLTASVAVVALKTGSVQGPR